MGFSLPAISCELSLPSNTGLFYLRVMNAIVANVHRGRPLLLGTTLSTWVMRAWAAYSLSRDARPRGVQGTFSCRPHAAAAAVAMADVPQPQINRPTGWQHVAAASRLISHYPQALMHRSQKGNELSAIIHSPNNRPAFIDLPTRPATTNQLIN